MAGGRGGRKYFVFYANEGVGLVRIYVEAGAAALHSPTWSFEVPLQPPDPRLRATSRPRARPRGWGRPPPRRRARTAREAPRRGGPAGRPHPRPGASGRSKAEAGGEAGARAAASEAKMVAATPPGESARPPPSEGNLLCAAPAHRAGGVRRPGRRGGVAGCRGGSQAVGAPAGGSRDSAPLARSHAGRRRRRVGPGVGGGAAAPGTRTDPARAARRWGGARGAHNGPSWRGRGRPAPAAGLGAHAGRGFPGRESFSRGPELKRLQNKAARRRHMGRPRAGRGRAHEVPARRLAAWRGREPAGPQTLCAPGWAEGAGLGARGLDATPHSAWALLTRVDNPRAGPATSRAVRPAEQARAHCSRGVEPSSPARWLRERRGKAGPSRRERRPRRHVPAGRAARGEGGGHGGDCAPPPIVPGLGLGPRATGTAVAEPPPLWAGPARGGGGCRGTQRRGGALASPPRSGLGAAGRRAAAAGKRGEGGAAASGGARLWPAPPGGRAGKRRTALPLVRHVLPAGLHERRGHFAVSDVPTAFSVPKTDQKGWELERAGSFLQYHQKEILAAYHPDLISGGNNSLSRRAATRS